MYEYFGMQLAISELDTVNREYFRHASEHRFHLQECTSCHLLRYPPATRCVWCSAVGAKWTPVESKGAVYSYAEVHHAIQPHFNRFLPYLLLLVELETQKGHPTPEESIRVVGNLVTADGKLAPRAMVEKVGIGTRVRMVFADVGPGLSIPQWALDEEVEQPAEIWRCPD